MWFAIELGVRIVVFTAVLALAVWKSPRIRIQRRWAIPLVGLVFALLNTGLYWLLSFVLKVATFGMAWLVAPFVVNAVLLWGTGKLLGKIRIKGIEVEGTWTLMKLSALLALVQLVASGVIGLIADNAAK